MRFRCVSTANDTDVTPKPRIAVVGTRFVKHDEAVEAQVRDRVRARVVERVLRDAVRREARVRAGVVQRQRPAAEDPAVAS